MYLGMPTTTWYISSGMPVSAVVTEASDLAHVNISVSQCHLPIFTLNNGAQVSSEFNRLNQNGSYPPISVYTQTLTGIFKLSSMNWMKGKPRCKRHNRQT